MRFPIGGADGTTVEVLRRAMDAAIVRHEVVADNIANVDTPGYKAKDVAFEEYLSAAMGESSRLQLKKTRPGHISNGPSAISEVQPVVREQTGTSMRVDGNNVDMEAETVKLVENQIMYNALTQLLNSKFQTIKYVIGEGKR